MTRPQPCGCSQTVICSFPTTSAEIACTLDAAGMRSRMTEFRDLFADGFLGTTRLDDGIRWRFVSGAEQLEQIVALARQEHACCPFFQFDILQQSDEIWWESRVSAEASQMLVMLEQLPELLHSS